MNKENYKDIYHFSKFILNHKKSNDVYIANDWLSSNKFHLGNIKNFQLNKLNYFDLIINIIFNLIKIIFIFFKFYKKEDYHNYKKKNFLFISHIIDKKKIKNNDDFYFKGFKKYLKKNKISYSFVYLNHKNYNDKSSFQLNNNIKFFTKLKNFSLIINEIFQILIFNKFNIHPFITRLKLIETTLSYETLNNLNIQSKFSEILNIIKPKKVFVTLEGYAYEKLVFKVANRLSIKTIGYQHTILNSKTNFFLINKIYNPSKILSSSLICKNIFIKKYNFKTAKIEVLGSHKRPVNFTGKNLKSKDNHKDNHNVLIAPEGIKEEVDFLFNFFLHTAPNLKNYRFIFRIHPLLKFKKHKYRKFLNNKNLTISQNSLSNDLKSCKYIVARGSAVLLEGINSNLIPIYVKNKNDLINLHPFSKNMFIPTVKNSNEFIKIVNLKDKKIYKDFDIVKRYSLKYFEKYNLEKILYV
jgi:hypothetical protein